MFLLFPSWEEIYSSVNGFCFRCFSRGITKRTWTAWMGQAVVRFTLYATVNDRADRADRASKKQFCNLQAHCSSTAVLLRTIVREVVESIFFLDDS